MRINRFAPGIVAVCETFRLSAGVWHCEPLNQYMLNAIPSYLEPPMSIFPLRPRCSAPYRALRQMGHPRCRFRGGLCVKSLVLPRSVMLFRTSIGDRWMHYFRCVEHGGVQYCVVDLVKQVHR